MALARQLSRGIRLAPATAPLFAPIASTSHCRLYSIAKPSTSRKARRQPASSKPSATSTPTPAPVEPKEEEVIVQSNVVKEETRVTKSPTSKIETIPFVLLPDQAEEILHLAAHSVLGLKSGLTFAFGKLLNSFLGIKMKNKVKLLTMKPLLMPAWRVDLRVKGKALLEGVQHNWSKNAFTSALNLVPLAQLPLSAPWDVEPEKFTDKHKTQLEGTEITVLPFTNSPVSLMKEVVKMPRVRLRDPAFDINPSTVKTPLFAAYPLYLPIYLGEFQELDGEQRRFTCAAHASTTKAFSFYLPWLDPPAWVPNDALDLTVSYGKVDSTEVVSPEGTTGFKKLLDEFVESGAKNLAISEEMGDVESVMASPHVMAFSEHAEANKSYLQAEEQQTIAQALVDELENKHLPDEIKAIVVSREGVKRISGKDLKEERKVALQEASEKEVEMRPKWLAELRGGR